jgi:hypothetical protein
MNMSDQIQGSTDESPSQSDKSGSRLAANRRQSVAIKSLLLLLVFALGGGGGYMIGRQSLHIMAPTSEAQSPVQSEPQTQTDAMSLMGEINPPEGYKVPAVFGDIGPQLLAAGAIDMPQFAGLYKSQNKPLTDEQMTILSKGTQSEVVFTPENAYFLLNFFWALGLTNQNAILTDGPMMSGGKDKVGGFASTGGWTLGSKQATDLYASTKIMTLTDEQQARLLEVASVVYRPCCNNPTHFPDCNHGMAMLGLLELMASQGASTAEMFEAAKYVTAFWYPQQMLELATAFKAADKQEFALVDAKTVVSYQYASISGFQAVHQWLTQNGLLEQAPSGGGSCGVK